MGTQRRLRQPAGLPGAALPIVWLPRKAGGIMEGAGRPCTGSAFQPHGRPCASARRQAPPGDHGQPDAKVRPHRAVKGPGGCPGAGRPARWLMPAAEPPEHGAARAAARHAVAGKRRMRRQRQAQRRSNEGGGEEAAAKQASEQLTLGCHDACVKEGETGAAGDLLGPAGGGMQPVSTRPCAGWGQDPRCRGARQPITLAYVRHTLPGADLLSADGPAVSPGSNGLSLQRHPVTWRQKAVQAGLALLRWGPGPLQGQLAHHSRARGHHRTCCGGTA